MRRRLQEATQFRIEGPSRREKQSGLPIIGHVGELRHRRTDWRCVTRGSKDREWSRSLGRLVQAGLHADRSPSVLQIELRRFCTDSAKSTQADEVMTDESLPVKFGQYAILVTHWYDQVVDSPRACLPSDQATFAVVRELDVTARRLDFDQSID